MNAHETTEIRELTATELDHVSGGIIPQLAFIAAGWAATSVFYNIKNAADGTFTHFSYLA